MTPKYVRKKDSARVLTATDGRLNRNDMFACDKQGRFLNTQEFHLPQPGDTARELAETDKDFKELRERARSLKVRGWNNAKPKTLEKKIKEAEAKLAESDETDATGE